MVEWAAMDFLLAADRKNRRRIRIEHLLLLLLRCLAVLFIAVLVSRPLFEPSDASGRVGQAAPLERIIVLDDSPSMTVQTGPETSFGHVHDSLLAFVNKLIEERPGDTITLLTTSNPHRPVLSGQYLSDQQADQALERIEELEVSHRAADMPQTLLAAERVLATPDGHLNRALYILSDMRRRDWLSALERSDQGPSDMQPAPHRDLGSIVSRLAQMADPIVMVDVGSPKVENLALTDVTSMEKSLAASVPTRFEVTVTNFGDQEAREVGVRFTTGKGMPLSQIIDAIPAGQSSSVPFAYTFREPGAVQVEVEIDTDGLLSDNRRYWTAGVSQGVPILLVDGKPSTPRANSEALYLVRALAPPGDVLSGNVVEMVTENQFEGISLESYQVIVLCNVYRISNNRRKALNAWVSDGGGLVMFLGDEVDELSYNQQEDELGGSLMPLKLNTITGDPSLRNWVQLVPQSSQHPVLRILEGGQNPFLEAIKIFRWWSGSVSADALNAGHTAVLATYSDPEASPAIIEKSVGAGRVLVVTTAIADWTNWTSDPSFVVTLLEIARYMPAGTVQQRVWTVGTPLRYHLDPGEYGTDATIVPPHGASRSVRAMRGPNSKHLLIEDDRTDDVGFYRLELTTHTGMKEEMLFAANIDPTEGDLHRVDQITLARQFASANVQFVQGQIPLTPRADPARTELWRAVLIAIVVVLCLEQLLAWTIGRRR